MLTDKEAEELKTLAEQLNRLPNRILIKNSTICDIEDAIAEIHSIYNDLGDLHKFAMVNAVNKLEKAKRQIKELL